MNFSKILLSEGRREQLFRKHMGEFKPEVLDIIFNDEFSKRTNYKYVDWILTHLDFDETPEAHEAMDLVKDFDRLNKNFEVKDINQYPDFAELLHTIQSYTSKSQEKKIESDAKKIYQDDRLLVVKPLSHKASCKYGAGTKWCTSEKSPGFYEKYTSRGEGLYYIIMKGFDMSNKFYKIALNITPSGDEVWYDSQDTIMPPREVELLKTILGRKVIIDINADFFKRKS